MTDRQTIDLYNARAGDYADLTRQDGPHQTLTDFMSVLPAGGRALDLGCGPGFAAAHMAAAGFVVDAWDASDSMVAAAAQHAGVAARQAGFDELVATDTYDGIWANFSLLHADRADMPGHLAAIARAVKPGGAFHIALKEGTGSLRDDLGRFYTYYTEDELTGLLQDAGFAPGPYLRGEDQGFDGTMARWIAVLSRA